MAASTLYGPIRKITCEEFLRMVELGIFSEDERIELLDGVITEMSPQSPQHSEVIALLTRYLFPYASDTRFVLIQQPVYTNDVSLPEPDAAVVPADAFDNGHPEASQSLLIVEVSLSSGTKDRKKSILYAGAGAPEYWILDVPNRRAEIHTEPGPSGYGVITTLDEFHEIAPGFAPHARISVASLMPKPK